MVQLKWNISDERGLEIIHTTLIQILSEQPKRFLPLNDLVFLLNNRTKRYNIHNNRKHNCLTKYINIKYKGIVRFLDSYSAYGIRIKENKEYVYLMLSEEECKDKDEIMILVRPWITRERDWVLL